MLYYKRRHRFYKHDCFRKPLVKNIEYLLDIRLGQIHRQALNDHQHRLAMILDVFHIACVHSRFCNLEDRPLLLEETTPNCHRLRQVNVIPAVVFSFHPITACIHTACDIHDNRVWIVRQKISDQLIKHDRPRDYA